MMTLTEQQRVDRALNEREFQGLVCELAGLFGWAFVHFRAARTERGWRVPVEGPLGKGWPDLVLVNPLRRRTLAVELKRELAPAPGPDQDYVRLVLEQAGWAVRTWRPRDLSSGAIEKELRS